MTVLKYIDENGDEWVDVGSYNRAMDEIKRLTQESEADYLAAIGGRLRKENKRLKAVSKKYTGGQLLERIKKLEAERYALRCCGNCRFILSYDSEYIECEKSTIMLEEAVWTHCPNWQVR